MFHHVRPQHGGHAAEQRQALQPHPQLVQLLWGAPGGWGGEYDQRVGQVVPGEPARLAASSSAVAAVARSPHGRRRRLVCRGVMGSPVCVRLM